MNVLLGKCLHLRSRNNPRVSHNLPQVTKRNCNNQRVCKGVINIIFAVYFGRHDRKFHDCHTIRVMLFCVTLGLKSDLKVNGRLKEMSCKEGVVVKTPIYSYFGYMLVTYSHY